MVAALNDGGQVLGTVYAEYMQASPAAVRADAAGREYLDRNWHLVAQNSFAGQSVQVRFFGLNSEFIRYFAANDGDASDVSSVSDLRLTQYAGNNEDCALDNNTAPTEVRLLTPTAAEQLLGSSWFSVTASVADHFSEFYLHGGSTALSTTSTPLPVELVSFTAERQGGAALLRWTTAQEVRNDRFEIEASSDGRLFQRIGQVAGQGSSAGRHDYTFQDADLHRHGSPLVYYRLRQVDQDGRATYSTVRVVQASGTATPLTAYPNPARTQVRVGGAAPHAPVELYDLVGRRLLRQAADAAGSTQLRLPEGLPQGVYLIRTGRHSLRLQVE